AVGTGGWRLLVRPRRGRTLQAPSAQPPAPPAPQATTIPAGSGDGESAAVPDTPAAATGVLEVERPPPSAGRLVRLRARLARSQSSMGSVLLSLLSRDRLYDDTWDEIEEALITADVGVAVSRVMTDDLRTKVKVLGTRTPDDVRGLLRGELLTQLGADIDRSLQTAPHGGQPAVV